MRFAIALLLATTTSSVKINGPHRLAQVEIPDYWGDHRFGPQYTWSHTDNPRYSNETEWVASSPAGYKEDSVQLTDAEIENRKSKFGRYHEPGLAHNWRQSFMQTEENQMTYPIADSASYIDPYNQRDHAWNDAQYDVSNETHWVLGSPRGSHLNVSRPLYHEIVGGGNANTTEAYGGYDNHWSEPTSFMMTMAEALEHYGLN